MSEHESREARMAEERAASAVLDVLLERMMFRSAADYSEGWAIGVIAAGIRDHSALLPVVPVVGEREADHQRAIRGFDDDGEPVCICGLTFWDDDVCVDCGDTFDAAYSRMARRRALAARTPEEEGL